MNYHFGISSVFFGIVLILSNFSCKNQVVNIDITGEVINPRTYIIPRADQPIIIDGSDDDFSWNKATFTEDFIDIEGQKIPDQKTRLKMLWDEDFIYIYAHVQNNFRAHTGVAIYICICVHAHNIYTKCT